MLEALLILAFSACLLGFQLALGSHFRHDSPLAPPMRALVVLSIGVWAVAVGRLAWGGAPGAGRLIPAIVLLGLAALLFVVTRRTTPAKVLPAAFGEEAPAHIIQSGPYAYVRHPFYVSYMLYWVGLAFAAPHPAVVGGVVLMLAAYAYLAHREEDRLLRGPLGEEYRRYVSATGRFIPRL